MDLMVVGTKRICYGSWQVQLLHGAPGPRGCGPGVLWGWDLESLVSKG